MPIEFKNVFYTYSLKTPFQTDALNDVNLTIEDGSFVAFIGSTGSGKSTIVQHMNGLLIPTQGEVIVDEFKIVNKKRKNKNIKQLRKHVGLVFQFPEYQLFEQSVEEDVAFGPKNFKVKPDLALKKAHEALISVGLDETYFKRSPFELSGGEKRRVAIAGILAIEPDILVLDEPTAGLDPNGANELMSLVCKMNKEGKTIILVTHDMDLVLKYCQKVFVVNEGKIISSGKPHDVFMSLPEDSSVEIPMIFNVANKLIKKGLSLDTKNIFDTKSLVQEIIKAEGDKR